MVRSTIARNTYVVLSLGYVDRLNRLILTQRKFSRDLNREFTLLFDRQHS